MKIKNTSKGFSLVELLIVVGIIVVLFSGVIISSYIFRNQIAFSSAVNGIKGIADEAKNSALSTLSYPDSDADIDGDGRTCPDPADAVNCDKILPNGYIVNFDSSGNAVKISLYADLMTSAVNFLDPENDVLIRTIELSEDIKISSQTKSLSGIINDLPAVFSVLYTSTDAEFYVLGAAPENAARDSLQVHITQVDSEDAVLREKYVYIHNLNNTAQITDNRMIGASP